MNAISDKNTQIQQAQTKEAQADKDLNKKEEIKNMLRERVN